MKKNLLILAAALAVCYSCSNDEIVESAATSDSNAISLRPLVNNVTRAANVDLQTNGFRVTAFETTTTTTPYFSNVDFTWNGSSYTSANKYYWPSGYNLDFYAWSPGGLSSTYNSIAVEPGTTISSQPDLVYGKATNWGKLTGSTGQHDGTTGVTINFRHAESKVIVQLKNTNSNLYFTVKDVKIGYLTSAGTFAYTTVNSGETATQNDGNLSNSDWTASSGHETDGVYQLADAASTSYNGAATQVGAEMILIPQTLTAATVYSAASAASKFNGAYILVEYKVQNVNSSGAYIAGSADSYVTAIWPLTAITWTPGYQYTYTVDLAGGGYYSVNQDTDAELDPILQGSEIMFATVTVDAWDAANYTVGNMVYAKGGSYTGNIVVGAGQYTITITGLTSGETVTPSATNGTVSSVGTAGSDGTFSFSLTVPANETGNPVTVTVTVDAATSADTTITLTQAAS